jgi:DNA-binding GntR family transcriptional regulator
VPDEETDVRVETGFKAELFSHLLKRPASRRQQLSGEIYDGIWKDIVSGRFRRGEKLLDSYIARKWSTSRTPVREALQQLARDGLVEHRERYGFFVATFSREDVGELYDFRTALESMATVLAVPRLSKHELEALSKVTRELRGYVENDYAYRFLKSDLQLHELIARTAANNRITQALGNIQVQLNYFQIQGLARISHIEASIDEHEELLCQLFAGEARKARSAMEDHIQQVKQRVLEAFFGNQEILRETSK